MSSDRVKAFLEFQGFTVGRELEQEFNTHIGNGRNATKGIEAAASFLISTAQAMGRKARLDELNNDARSWEARLILMYSGMVLSALSERNTVKLAKALGDLQYVVEGTAVVYGIPLSRVVDEIHRANRMKPKRSGPDPFMQNRGDDYEPPNIAGVLGKEE